MTAFASVDTAVRTLRQGVFDYIIKPIELDELCHLVARAMEQRRSASPQSGFLQQRPHRLQSRL